MILGAGIAGLSAAWALALQGFRNITVVEREPVAAAHASGRNAAIYRPLEEDPWLVELATRSLELLDELAPRRSLVRQTGLLLADGSPERLRRIARQARAFGIDATLTTTSRGPGASAALGLHSIPWELWSSDGGVLDIHGIITALSRRVRRAGIRMRFKTRIARVETKAGRALGVVTDDGELISADVVVIAAGAWSASLAPAGQPRLVPVRRHLALLSGIEGPWLDRDAPVVWRLDDETYFRPESGGLLASPCDETHSPTGVAHADLEALAPLSRKLGRLHPALAEAEVRAYWACVRTKTPGGRPLIGPDPQTSGLYWLSGLGGFGMTCGLAAGEVLARSIVEESAPVVPRHSGVFSSDDSRSA